MAGELPQDGNAKYQRILRAALQVFAARGFHEAKIADIARAAGVADGTIYLYFKNKDDLLISLFEAQLAHINTGLAAVLATATDPMAQLRAAVDFHLGLARDDPPLAQLITVELRRSSRFMHDYAKGQLRAYLDQLAAIVDAGKSQGLFRTELSAAVVTHILFGALDYVCLTWVNNPNRREEQLTAAGEALLDILARALVA